jgi:two-component system, response regulator
LNDAPILLVEDNPDDVMLTLRAFEKNHISNPIIVAADGEEALDYLLPSAGRKALRPAIVLMDIKLPKLDGLAVLRRLRKDERTRPLPVVMLTTSNEERDIVESYRLGANSYVRKPVVFGEFLDAARILGLYWLLVNETAPVQPAGV